jgi:hypothetical protein
MSSFAAMRHPRSIALCDALSHILNLLDLRSGRAHERQVLAFEVEEGHIGVLEGCLEERSFGRDDLLVCDWNIEAGFDLVEKVCDGGILGEGKFVCYFSVHDG